MRASWGVWATILAAGAIGLSGCNSAEEAPKATPGGPVASGPAATPESLVRALYALPKPPDDKAGVEAFFTPEFVPGMAPGPGRPPAVAWDYRSDAVGDPPTDLAYAVKTSSAVGAKVTVTFNVRGKPDSMVYDLCKRSDGEWRIRNVIDPDDRAGSMRYVWGVGPMRAGQCPMPTP